MMSAVSKCDHFANFRRELEIARKELKNIRQELQKQKAVHQKEVTNFKQMLNDKLLAFTDHDKISEQPVAAVTTKNICNVTPIGYIKSWFKSKNGTPRQPVLCPLAKAFLKIEKSVFSNPEHSLVGLEEFSYVWIIFIFHKNKDFGSFQKAKVHPPRLNGNAVGVFSTRSPHRPNAIGLSLTKLEKIEGDTLFLSGVDLLDGTPVLDIKPFIPSYDVPCYNDSSVITCQISTKKDSQVHEVIHKKPLTTEIKTHEPLVESSEDFKSPFIFPNDAQTNNNISKICETKQNKYTEQESFDFKMCSDSTETLDQHKLKLNSNLKCCKISENFVQHQISPDSCEMAVSNEKAEPNSLQNVTCDSCTISKCSISSWLMTPPVSLLNVGFTPRAEQELQMFHNNGTHVGKCHVCLSFLQNTSEAKLAIVKVLQQDPRSVYRRKKCLDRLYYFCVDAMHLTCWFDDDSSYVEVLKIKPISL